MSKKFTKEQLGFMKYMYLNGADLYQIRRYFNWKYPVKFGRHELEKPNIHSLKTIIIALEKNGVKTRGVEGEEFYSIRRSEILSAKSELADFRICLINIDLKIKNLLKQKRDIEIRMSNIIGLANENLYDPSTQELMKWTME